MSSSTVTYTSISSDYKESSDVGSPRVVVYVYDGLPMYLVDPYVEAALQAPEQAPPSPDYVLGPKHPPYPEYMPGPEEPEQAPLSPDYVHEPEYPEYLVPSDVEAPIEDQPLPDDASPTTLSPGYLRIQRHLRPDESEPIPVPSLRRCTTWMSIRASTPMSGTAKALIDEYASAPAPQSPPPYPLSPLSSPLPKIPSSPLSLPSPPTTSLTYAVSPLGYRAARIQARFTAPNGRFEVGESSSTAAARQAGHTIAHTVDYGFIDTLDASIRGFESKAMTTVGVVNDRVTDLATTKMHDAQLLYMRCEDA
nr:hypothetical protein [Tanacetum cinerariifolium]